ncbi:MAG: hypothetical protein HY908_01335 [Myxococcales bacterium]|nr:hypothetical protein [Myxococcales bacterium]
MTIDRRFEGQRLQADCSLTLFVDGSGRAARTLDLSCGGALVHEGRVARRGLPLVCPVELRLGGGASIQGLARTVRSGGGRHALRFIGMSEVDRLEIAEHLDRLRQRRVRAA